MNTTIRLPFGGAGASFNATALVKHVQSSGSDYIIQGQTACALSAHPKPRSLDVWLRRNYTANKDTKQADNSVIAQLVSTGLFETGRFLCPDSGKLCKGIRLVDTSAEGKTHGKK